MRGLHTLEQILRRNDYMTKMDLSDYDFHYRIHPKHRRYVRFMFDRREY